MNRHPNHPEELDADADTDDAAPMDEIEYDELEGTEIAVEVELLRARVQAARFSGA